MAYTALFQGLPVRFTGPVAGSASCTLVLDDVTRVLEALGVDAATQSTLTTKANAGTIGFGLLTHWLEDLGQTQITMFTHWLLRHMPAAQVALGLPLLGYLQGSSLQKTATRQVKRRAAA
jgi:hypothetical protein